MFTQLDKAMEVVAVPMLREEWLEGLYTFILGAEIEIRGYVVKESKRV